MVSVVLSSFLTAMMILVGVAFFIVTERKGLGMVQLRQGPNKVGLKGLVQPLSDGVKLLTKGFSIPAAANPILFVFGPILCFFMSYISWVIYPLAFCSSFFKYSVLFFMSVSCLNVYGLILVGWSSNCQYGLLGSMRAVAQSISYELIMSTVMMCSLLFLSSLELFLYRDIGFSFIFVCIEAMVIWFITVLAETNRAPFDFVEGESELVAGYNVEFGGFGFALIALAEYGAILFMSMMSGLLFFGGFMPLSMVGNICAGLLVVVVSYVIVCVRGAYPRFRYDQLMEFCWVKLLPVSLGLFILSVGMVIL
uniref:NADH dehydrogenase subunit 1 n=1 Tax=Novaculina chinensis TaxID=3033849 RepID=UPI002551D769|nr:NADH dehydrogenase subunit 1 [Novaculina chinensis]WGC44269.1 NADH dehydrogenase subunit 1 [Novaculina chinensis]